MSCCADLLIPPMVSIANGRCTASIASAVAWYLITFFSAASSANVPAPLPAS